MRYALGMAACAVLCAWIAGCTATVPEGIYACGSSADCPSGFECRDEGEGLYCYRPGGANAGTEDAGRGGRGGTGGAAGTTRSGAGGGAPGAGKGGAAGDAGMPMAGADAGTPPGPVAPTATGFTSLGGVRSGGGLRLYDERFERGERRCTEDERLCLTGGFEP